jgi:hypothetical protein
MAEQLIRLRDPVHGFIHLSQKELKLVESAPFRRLRNVKQLALTCLVYPGAMHTRFEHSLGVMELATRAFDALMRKFDIELKRNFSRLDMSAEEGRELLRVTALLHDIGHLPFSHGAEDILPLKQDGKRTSHEEVSIAIVRNTPISEILQHEYNPQMAEHVCLLLDENREVPPELLILKKLISGQFDADKMDYLARDSLHCGVGYGNFDCPRLLETIRVKDAEEGGLELSIERGGVHTLEAMVLARYWMFTQVYFHKTRRIYDKYLSHYLKAWYSGQYDDLLGVLSQDDLSLTAEMRSDDRPNADNPERQTWAHRILNRQHHRVVYETSDHALPDDEKVALKVERALKERYPGIEFMCDLDARGTVHKFYVKGVDEEMGEEFPVYDNVSRRYSRLSEESRIFEKVPKRFRVIRVYAGVPKDSLNDYRSFAREEARKFREAI